MKLIIAAQTDIGKSREINEDSYGISTDNKLVMLCDGMGGHNAGEIASRTAVDTILKFFEELGSEDVERICPDFSPDPTSGNAKRLIAAIRLANQRIYLMSRKNPDHRGMGTTIAASYFNNNYFIAAHVGDSRIYRFRNNRLEQLTEDHVWISDFENYWDGQKEATKSNIITRAVGIEPTIKIDIFIDTAQVGDQYLLCSDGLSGTINNDEINQILINSESNDVAVKRLINAANDHGGPDNITAVLITILKTGKEKFPLEGIKTTVKNESEEVTKHEKQIINGLLTGLTETKIIPPRKRKSHLALAAVMVLFCAFVLVIYLFIFNKDKKHVSSTPGVTPGQPIADSSRRIIEAPPAPEVRLNEGTIKLFTLENYNVTIFLDNQKQGKSVKLGSYELQVPAGVHQIKVVVEGTSIIKKVYVNRNSTVKINVEDEFKRLKNAKKLSNR